MPLTLMLLLPFTYNQWDTKLCFFAQKNYFSVDTFLPDLEYLPWNTTDMYSEPNDALSQRYSLFKVAVDLQRPNFMTFFFFAHNIAKTSI